MTTSLTPEIALAYVRELSADFRAGVVLERARQSARGRRSWLAAAARACSRRTRARASRAGPRGRPGVRRAHVDARDRASSTGRFALPRVARRDLRTALAGLGAETAQETPSERSATALVKALVDSRG